MPTLLMGHGSVLTDQEVIVPEGMTMSFLIDASRVMPFSNGVGVVMNIATLQDEGFSLSSSHQGGEKIANHQLHVLTNNQRGWYAQVDPEDGSCYYAGESFGDGLRLCEDPGPDGQCASNPGGVHTCGGILSFTFSSPDLYWVSCRQDPTSQRMHPQQTFGSEANDREHVQSSDFVAFANQVEQKLKDDPAGFADYFDSLTPEQVAQVLYKQPVRRWSFQREARSWLASGTTEEQLYAFILGQDDADQGLYLADKELKAAYDRGKFVRQAREYLEGHGEDNFRLYVNGLDRSAQDILATYPDLASVLAVTGDPLGAGAQSARFGISVAEIDWAIVQGVNADAVKNTDDKASVPFWQLPTGEVLIGRDQPEVYRKLIELVRDGNAEPTGNVPNGQIKVTKGGITSKGRLDVTGASDTATMKSWLEAFSDKKIGFA